MDFGTQVGVEDRSKIDPKGRRKSDEKKKVTKMAKKTFQERATWRDSGKMDPGKGVGGRVTPSPKGRKEGYRNSVAF